MSERDEIKSRGHRSLPLPASGRGLGGEVNADEARLRALCAAADLPLKPSQDLRRRVAESAVRHDALAARLRSPWQGWNSGWAPAAGAVAVTFLLAFLGIRLLPGQRMPVSSSNPPRLAQQHLQTMAAPSWSHTGRDASNTPSSARPRTPGVPSPAVRRAVTAPLPAAPVDDLVSVNGNITTTSRMWSVPARGRAPTPPGADLIGRRARPDVPVRDDFIWVPFPRIASTSDRQAAAAAEQYRHEAAVVDARLSVAVTVEQKGTALVDLCERLRADSGIQLGAGQSVADEKVTVFCEKQPLRDVMRQLSRPFGYTWLRSGRQGEYKYELVQDLRSQLLEEELRNRDRNEALLALEREVERFRPYLGLTPDEALARSKTAPPAEKRLLETLAGHAWGLIQMYYRLSAQEQAALRAGQELTFSEPLRPGEQPRAPWYGSPTLPPNLGRGVLQSHRNRRLVKGDGGYEYTPDENAPGALAPAAVPEARGKVRLQISQSELGRFTLHGLADLFTIGEHGQTFWAGGDYSECATGTSPAVLKPNNAAANARFAGEPALRARVTILPQPSCIARPPVGRSGGVEDPSDGNVSEPQATTADVLEALHRAAGMPIVADYYTRLYPVNTITLRNRTLFEALNGLADAMRLRWSKDGGWLQFRSTSFYDDRLKEVPNRLLTRWAAARRQRGILTIDDLCEIAQLPDAQLDGGEMAEGARECFGLTEWDLGRSGMLRRHLRFLADFTPTQRQEAMSGAGLPFTKMSLPQQQEFMAFGLGGAPLESRDELDGAVLRVEYTQPGGFQWGEPGWSGYYTRWVIPLGPGPQDRRVPRPPVQARTREAALAAVRGIDPQLREALFQAVRRADPRVDPDPRAFDESQIFPTQRDLTFVYIPGSRNARSIFVLAGAAYSTGHCHYRQR